jgi:hypothetical protein
MEWWRKEGMDTPEWNGRMDNGWNWEKDRLEVERLYDLPSRATHLAFGVAPTGSYETSSSLAKLGKSPGAKPTQLMMPNDGTTFARGAFLRRN